MITVNILTTQKNTFNLVKNILAEKHFKTGFEYARRNRIESAAYEYRKAIEYNPDYASARAELDSISDKLAHQYYGQGMNSSLPITLKKPGNILRKRFFMTLEWWKPSVLWRESRPSNRVH